MLFERFFSTRAPPEEVVTTRKPAGIMAETVAAKRATPGDDLASALVLASEDGERLTDEEIVSTLQLVVAAGHETTISLIVNAVVNLSAHPEQRALVLSGEADWSDVVEETLRYSTPTSHVLIRFATEDVPAGDRVLAAGDALIVSYGALGRDEGAHGPTAGASGITRASRNRHIAIGHGPHVCPGAALSRLEPVWRSPPSTHASPGLTWRCRCPNCATSRWSRERPLRAAGPPGLGGTCGPGGAFVPFRSGNSGIPDAGPTRHTASTLLGGDSRRRDVEP